MDLHGLRWQFDVSEMRFAVGRRVNAWTLHGRLHDLLVGQQGAGWLRERFDGNLTPFCVTFYDIQMLEDLNRHADAFKADLPVRRRVKVVLDSCMGTKTQ